MQPLGRWVRTASRYLPIPRRQAPASSIGVVIVLALPSFAERWSHSDPRHDGYPGGEVSGLYASNHSSGVTVRVRFADLVRRDAVDNYAVIRTARRTRPDYML